MNRRDFFRSAAAATVVSVFSPEFIGRVEAGFDPVRTGFRPLPCANAVKLGGIFGQAYDRGLARLKQSPFDTNFVLADVNFNQKRWFTNFSGDISGRFIEINSSAASDQNTQPECLQPVIDQIVAYQKPEGYFGAQTNWWAEADLTKPTDDANMMPILWGNGRLLLGLTAAWNAFRKDSTLAAAKRLGDFYVKIVEPRFCDPKRLKEYEIVSPGYASAYVTCVYEGMEGLVQLYRATKDKRYLDCACRMADFHEHFDVLPVRHSHGSLSEHEGLMMIYEETGDRKYLDRVVKRWNDAVTGGYVNACGSILEKFWVTDDYRDEGCTEADWLRLNLMLWRATGENRYLDMVERLLYNGYIANQWPSGGFGHRFIGVDKNGPYSYKKYSQESLWCCSFHGPLGLFDFHRYLAVPYNINGKDGQEGILINFGTPFKAPVEVNGKTWTIELQAAGETAVSMKFTAAVTGPADETACLTVRKPGWANDVWICSPDKPDQPLDVSKITSGMVFRIEYRFDAIRVENRRLTAEPTPKKGGSIAEAALFNGPAVLIAKAGGGERIESLKLTLTDEGALLLPGGMALDSEPSPLTVWKKLIGTPALEDGHTFLFNLTVE